MCNKYTQNRIETQLQWVSISAIVIYVILLLENLLFLRLMPQEVQIKKLDYE